MTDQLKPCPFCGTSEHLTLSTCGSFTGDMPARPHRVLCTHIDHDVVEGPVGYGHSEAIAAWNTRAATPSQDIIEKLTEALEEARPYVADYVEADGGIENCEYQDRRSLEIVNAALSLVRVRGGQ